MDKFETHIGGRKARDISTDESTGADHAAALALYHGRDDYEFDLDTQISVQATRDDGNGVVTALQPDTFSVRDVLEWIRLGGVRRARPGEPEDFYTTLEELADDMLPEEEAD